MTAAHVESPQPEAEIVAEPPEAGAPVRPVFYRSVHSPDVLAPDAFLPAERSGGLHVARLKAPLLVQSPTVTLASPLWEDDCDGEPGPPPHAHLAVPEAFAGFAGDVENAALAAALAHKDAWFKGRVDERTIVAAFKPMLKPATGHLKVALGAEGAEVFDPAGALLHPGALAVGDRVRCILRLDGIVFGRTEFGAMWTLVQAQARPAAPPPPPPPTCLLSAEDDDEPQPVRAGRPQPEAAEFL